MRIRQIKNLLAMRNSYHPILNRLFRNYGSHAVTAIMTFIVGASCLFLLWVAFMGLSYLYLSFDERQVLSISKGIVFMYSFLTTVKSAYDFLYSGRDRNLLKSLPVTRLEVIASNFVYFYKNQILVSVYLSVCALAALVKMKCSAFSFLEECLSAFMMPAVTVLLTFVISSAAHLVFSRIDNASRHKELSFPAKTSLSALVNYEMKNLLLFSSLKVEIGMQIFVSLMLTLSAITVNPGCLGFVALYQVLGMINVSSFSREGAFHNILQTLPIENKKRIWAKALFYMLIVMPVFVLCFGITMFMRRDVYILLALVPSLIFVMNITLTGIESGQKNPKTHWTNPQEAFQMNFSYIFGGLLFGTVTEALVFIPEVIGMNRIAGLAVSLLLNMIVFLFVKPKK